jgi:hypothetical protein
MTGASRKPLLKNLCFLAVFGAVLVSGYVLSYAPVYRLWYGASPPPLPAYVVSSPLTGANQTLPGYRPVEWLMSRTILREPLCRWADLWGIGPDVRGRILFYETLRSMRDYINEQNRREQH